MAGVRALGDPSMGATVASDPRTARQPFSQPLGALTGTPTRTRFLQVLVTPLVNGAGVRQPPTLIVEATRENRFVILTAPLMNFRIFINSEANLSLLGSLSLPSGLPFEIPLPGNQALYAVTNAPVFLPLQIQIAAAIASDTERRLAGL
jgi:hypothetical protein